MSIACVFPGQGSQTVGMGRAFYEAFPTAREVFEEVDETLKQKLSTLIFEGPQEDLTLTENAQPALMTVSLAIQRVMAKEFDAPLASIASHAAGHSLGEYAALCACGGISLSDTAQLLRLRGSAMQQAVPVGQGAMAAILGLQLEQVEDLLARLDSTLEGICVIANDNCPGQIVISGHATAVRQAMASALEAKARRAVELPVSAPFHCALMQPAAEKMEPVLLETACSPLSIPVVANVTAQPVQSPTNIADLLTRQITARVRWRESMLYLIEKGVTYVVELGAGKVLTGLAKRIHPDLKAISVNTPDDLESFLTQT